MFAEAWRAKVGLLALVGASIAGVGCSVQATGEPSPPIVVGGPGRLTVRWTVAESTDPNLCALGRAAAIDISVSTSTGRFAGEFQAPCSSFATTISSLYPDTYVADALLIDSAGLARTTDLELDQFTIIQGSELVLDVDFPADSFLNGAPFSGSSKGLSSDAAATRDGGAGDTRVQTAPPATPDAVPAQRAAPPDFTRPAQP